MRIVKHDVHKAITGCNFCARGVLNRNDGISYPYTEVYSFQREAGNGVLAFICEDCLKQLCSALPIPASAEQEAERLYPYHPQNDEMYTDSMVTNIQRSAHINAARMYMGEIERITEQNHKLMAENDTLSEELGELKNITEGLDRRVINQQRDLLIAYRNKIALTPGTTIETVLAMLEDDIQTLRTMDGGEIIKTIKK